MTQPRLALYMPESVRAQCFADADWQRIVQQYSVGSPVDATVLLTGWGTEPIGPDELGAMAKLRFICHSAGSVKGLLEDVRQTVATRGIIVSTAAAALARGVAEFAFAMMLVSMKNVWAFHRLTAAGQWNRDPVIPRVCEPCGAVVGIVGASRTGREMIHLCRQLDLAQLLVADPYLSDADASALGVQRVPLDNLFARADVVSLHTPATAETRHLVGAPQLASMRDGAILINTARGACVDEAALIAELREGRILACIDVTDPEPPDPESPLFALPNCILTPHIAGSIRQNCFRQGRLVADQLEAFAAGRPVPEQADLSLWDRLA